MENLIKLFVNVSRAYEVALLGGFSISLSFDKDYLAGFSDYELIKSFYSDVEFKVDGDLNVVMQKPTTQLMTSKLNYETLNDIKSSVKKAMKRELPTSFIQDTVHDSLIGAAITKRNLSINDVSKVKKIAAVIAQLDNKSRIGIEHTAEAILYTIRNDDANMVQAESKTINFGYGIKISLLELDNQDVKMAINYLTNLIKS